VLDRTVIYAASGGQPGDRGVLTTRRRRRRFRSHVVFTDAGQDRDRARAGAKGLPAAIGRRPVRVALDWPRGYARMRMHTALHLLSAVLPYPVTGGSIGESESRLDFDIPEAGLDKDAITAKLAEMIAADAARDRALDQPTPSSKPIRARQDHVGQAADGHRPRAADRDRRPRPAALRRHARALHRRDRRGAGDQIEKKGKQNRRVRLACLTSA
jgi:misacylated tRNA(Ala) deacylase